MLAGRDPRKGFGYLLVYPLILFLLISLFLNLSAGMNIVSWARFEIGNLINQQQFSYVHPFRAPAWTWPFLLRSTPFYAAEAGRDRVQTIIAFGNPAVYWLAILVMFWLLLKYLRERNFSLLFILIGFFGSFLPWVIYDLPFLHNPRLFFYYFLPSIPFYIMGLSYALDGLFHDRRGRILAILYLSLVFALFFFFSPLLYGLPVSLGYFHRLIWLKGWWM
jgi:dolichyl-phosphate-mannose--protein O-mannosyl transferase